MGEECPLFLAAYERTLNVRILSKKSGGNFKKASVGWVTVKAGSRCDLPSKTSMLYKKKTQE